MICSSSTEVGASTKKHVGAGFLVQVRPLERFLERRDAGHRCAR